VVATCCESPFLPAEPFQHKRAKISWGFFSRFSGPGPGPGDCVLHPVAQDFQVGQDIYPVIQAPVPPQAVQGHPPHQAGLCNA